MATPLPEEFVCSMREMLGTEAESLFEALDTPAEVSIRVNPAKPVETFEGEAVGWSKYGRYLEERPQFTLDPLLHGGAYYVQEASSQFVSHILEGDDLRGGRILDMCAAPGGKTTVYSTKVGREGLVVANDISHSRALALSDNVKRWGMGNVVVVCNEPADIANFEEWFDVVAVDAPCSGEGMFRKMEEARAEWSSAGVKQCVARQREIVAEAWRTLRPGGKLIYSTCTFNASEDEGVVEWLVEEFGDDMVAAGHIETLDEWGIVRSDIGPFQCFHFYPHKARGEGFFAAVVRKGEGAVRRRAPKVKRSALVPLKGAELAEVSRWVDGANEMSFRSLNGTIIGYHNAVVEDVVQLAGSLYVVYSGVVCGEIFKGVLKPEHPLALYVWRNRSVVAEVEVNLEDALNYLRKQDIAVAQFKEGINVVMYKGVAIGFVKRIGQRCNNMYPKDLRILKL